MIAVGTKLGPYEILSALGAGGMGEVYRARDARLGRDVAIKVLAAHLSSNPDFKARFEREARAISALNHPHICHLYDIGSHEGTDYLVMEFLEGETLAQRLARGALPFAEIVPVGVAIAEALALAHRQGIVHRDLKPGNIMLTKTGAKLMDFGLAKPLTAQSAAVSGTSAPSFTAAATLSGPSPVSPLTGAGSIVGTIQYMSPEQIEGKEADARSDIFAMGTVLYEMAAGKRPFAGKSQISLASAILESDPQPISVSKPGVPAGFEKLVTTCLRKNPEERFQNAYDVKLELEWIAAERPAAAAPATISGLGTKERLAWVAGVIAAAILGVLGFFLFSSRQPAPAIRAAINPPEKTSFDLTGDVAGPPVLSPDGNLLAFAAAGQDGKVLLWVRPMNSLEAHVLPDTDGAVFPFWSPDSRSIGFFANGKLKTIDADGGSALVVCDAQLGRGGAWGANGTILFSSGPSTPLMTVSASGGTPVAITKIDTALHTSHRWPFLLPDGKHYLYLAIHHDASKLANNAVYYASLDGGNGRLLFHAQSNAIYAAGYLLFTRGDQLVAQSFDPARGKLSGESQIVARGVMSDASTWHMVASASDNGLLAFATGVSADLQLVWLDRASKQLSPIAEKLTNLLLARVSPQGDRVALQIDSGANDVWTLDLKRGVRTRLTFGPVANLFPVWSPDGKWVAYSSIHNNRVGIYRKRSDGSGAEEALFEGGEGQLEPDCWSRDGKYLIYTVRPAAGVGGPRANLPGELWMLPLTGERKPQMLMQQGSEGVLSPDGRWLAYISTESGTAEVYVVAFGGGQGKWQVSSAGGSLPHWSADGRELFYVDPSFSLFAVPVRESSGALQFGAAALIVNNWSTPQFFFDLSPDSKKLLLARVPQQISQSVSLITNWTAGLKK